MKILLIAIAGLAIFGCNSEDAQNVTQDAKKLAGSAGDALAGMTLAGKVNVALGLRKNVDMTGLHIEAKDGVVTVGGHVDTVEEKKIVLQVVDGTKGVDKVVDNLRVKK